MNAREALATIRRLATRGLVIVTDHADEEMAELGVMFADVVHVLVHAKKCEWQPKHCTWKVKGADRFGVTLAIAVDVQASVVVVTVFD